MPRGQGHSRRSWVRDLAAALIAGTMAILIEDVDICDPNVDLNGVRSRIGMVF